MALQPFLVLWRRTLAHYHRAAFGVKGVLAVCSGYIADGVIRGLFGFMPSLEATNGALALKQPNVARGFEGTLKHVRYRGELWTITSSAQGVRAEKE